MTVYLLFAGRRDNTFPRGVFSTPEKARDAWPPWGAAWIYEASENYWHNGPWPYSQADRHAMILPFELDGPIKEED